MNTIYLLRHGRTRANEKRLYCGATDEPLSESGLDELLHLRGYPEKGGLTLLTSGMVRTKETLRALYGNVASRAMPALTEMSFGVFEMKSYDELKENAEYISWITDETSDFACPGGESANAFKARIFTAFDALAAENRDFLVVTHGGVIANIMARAFPRDNCNFYEWQPGFGRGYAIRLAGGKPQSYREIPKTE